MNARKLTRISLLVVLIVLLAAGVGFYWLASTGRPVREGRLVLFELAGPVKVRFDEWAVPHVEASTGRDLAMALGWLHANERMTQMELCRRAALGRLSEMVGEVALPADRDALELRLWATAEGLVDALSVEHRGLLEAYALGVNSWLERSPNGLPPELVMFGVQPRAWKVADSMACMLLLARDLSYPRRFEEQRWTWLARAGVERLSGISGKPIELDPQIERYLREHPVGASLVDTSAPIEPKNGSNSWALGATRTNSESPLVANDPHLPLGVPSVWYQALLRSPDYEAMGMTLPGLPFVVIGQNAELAWAFTNTELDTNDLFIEELSPDGSSVRRGDQFVPLLVERVTIPVRGGETHSFDLLRSDLGPFYPADPTRDLPPRSLAWTAHTLFDPLSAFYALGRAKSVKELPALVENFVCPVQNLVAADRSGGMLFTLLGRVPERAAGDGRIPLPAWDLSKRWRGLRAASDNPRIEQPVDDFLATANNDVRPPDYALPLPAEFDMAFRADRARELLTARSSWWPAEAAEVQSDATSLYARRIVSLLPDGMEGEAAFARHELAAWNGTMQRSGTSALFALFEREFSRAVYSDELERYAMRSLPGLSRGESVLAALDGSLPDVWFDDLRTADRVETRADAVQLALATAWREGTRRFGPSVKEWNYGGMHTWTVRHPLDALPLGTWWLNRGSYAMAGSATSLSAFSGPWRGEHMQVVHGPSMRWIADTGDPDRSLCILPTGQSGHPADPHYDDQLPIFLAGKTHGMHWSEAAIANSTVSTLLLTP